jgi:alpha-galactosidase
MAASFAPPISDVVRLDGGRVSLVVALGDAPRLLYIGERLPDEVDLENLKRGSAAGKRESQPDRDLGLTLLPQADSGFQGEPAVAIEVPGIVSTDFRLAAHDAAERNLRLEFVDPVAELGLALHWRITDHDILCARAEITNRGSAPVRLNWLASLTLPLPGWANTAVQVHGRWSGEFRLATTPLVTGRVEKTNRSGRSGFDGAHYLMAGEADLREERGRAVAAHLAWSGNARSLVETLPTGERQLQIGEWLAPGEWVLGPGESHRTPEALVAVTADGFNGIRRSYHAELRSLRAASGVAKGPRKVHFNSWEAAYFDVDQQRLMALAEAAASLGAERFILDDGWFRGRRDDRSSLGDWTVDSERFPDGLWPLIARVKALGMDFGLWIEPEMVSPDSELYRLHPDWCLHEEGRGRPTQRAQLVLDLSRPEVADHLFGAIDLLLSTYPIAALKWDHNRELFPAASRGRPCARAQNLAFHALLSRVRTAHPKVEIEGCASGGARIDFSVAEQVARVWPSDNTDAVERLRIHRAMSLFYPPEMIGAHFGASPNPTTSRRLSVDFRARVAMFAHFGIEADPARLPLKEREQLAGQVAEYKRWRGLIHAGDQLYADCDDPAVTAQIVVAKDGSEALALCARTDQSVAAIGPLLRFPGLIPTELYSVTLVEPWPSPAAHHLAERDFWRSKPVFAGAVLEKVGLRLPIVHPETAWVVHLARTAR